MDNIVWKAFTLKELFVPITGRDSNIAQKNLDKSIQKDNDYSLAIITETMQNNGVGFYMKANDPLVLGKVIDRGLTYGTQFGNANYHDYPHFIIGNTNYLRFQSSKFQELCDKYIGNFLAILLNKIFKKSGLFGYGNKIDQDSFSREIILLPCVETTKEDNIWEDNQKYYVIASNYIKNLVSKAYKIREENTIHTFNSIKSNLLIELEKTKDLYLNEKNILIWKAFTLKELFVPITGRDSNIAQKNLDKSIQKDNDYSLAIITETMQNNGVGFYMKANDPLVLGKVIDRGLTYGTQFGNANYHDYPHFIIGNTNYLRFQSSKFQELCDKYIGNFLAILLNKIFKKSGLFGYGNKIDQDSFSREIILLPCVETTKEDNIWEDNQKYYVIASNYVRYIYLLSRIKLYDTMINNFYLGTEVFG